MPICSRNLGRSELRRSLVIIRLSILIVRQDKEQSNLLSLYPWLHCVLSPWQTVVKVLASSLGLAVHEWSTPVPTLWAEHKQLQGAPGEAFLGELRLSGS